MNRYDSPSAQEHREKSPQRVACAVLTVSDTRTLADDRSGDLIVELLEQAGHIAAARSIVPDEPQLLQQAVQELVAKPDIAAILVAGGTGIAARDQTPDTLARLFSKELSGFGELFRMLSYQEIGAAAMLSRAGGGLIDQTVVLLMPGSTPAVRLAMERLILPELGHMVELAGKA